MAPVQKQSELAKTIGRTLLAVGSLKGAECILKGIIISPAATGQCTQCKVLHQLNFWRQFPLPASPSFGRGAFGLPLLLASLFRGPQMSHIPTKPHLFCKAHSFSPKFACSETHRSSPAKAFPPGASQLSSLLCSSPSHKPFWLWETQFLSLCLGLPPISTESKLFHRALQHLLLTSVPRASLSQLTDGAFPNLLLHLCTEPLQCLLCSLQRHPCVFGKVRNRLFSFLSFPFVSPYGIGSGLTLLQELNLLGS